MSGVPNTSHQLSDHQPLVRLESEPDKPLSRTVVEALAKARGVAPADLLVDVYGAVDPDALDTLQRHTQRTDAVSTVTFEVEEFEVHVRTDGVVTVH